MTRRLRARSACLFGLLLAAGLSFGNPAAAQPDAPAPLDASVVPNDAPSWQPMGDAIFAAQADDRIVLVHTYAKWCGWCARLDRDTYTDDAVQAYMYEHFAVTRLDLEGPDTLSYFGRRMPQSELASALGITGTPTTLFLDTEGRIITRYPGFAPPDRFLYILRYVNEGAYELMPFEDFVEMVEHAAQRGG